MLLLSIGFSRYICLVLGIGFSIQVNIKKVTPYLQDGAGRVGKMIFARQGKKFDYDLKQVRLVSLLVYFIFSSHHKIFLTYAYVVASICWRSSYGVGCRGRVGNCGCASPFSSFGLCC